MTFFLSLLFQEIGRPRKRRRRPHLAGARHARGPMAPRDLFPAAVTDPFPPAPDHQNLWAGPALVSSALQFSPGALHPLNRAVLRGMMRRDMAVALGWTVV